MVAGFLPHFRAVTGMLICTATICAAAADADNAVVKAGKKLAAEAKCEACHISKVGGDGSAIYTRKDRRVSNRSKLLPQVARCNSELSLGLFPEDEAAIAAYLNAAHYKFKD
ncbi:MAG: hypothetical protein ABI790_09345 [Betaproteobacteria bacterium]